MKNPFSYDLPFVRKMTTVATFKPFRIMLPVPEKLKYKDQKQIALWFSAPDFSLGVVLRSFGLRKSHITYVIKAQWITFNSLAYISRELMASKSHLCWLSVELQTWRAFLKSLMSWADSKSSWIDRECRIDQNNHKFRYIKEITLPEKTKTKTNNHSRNAFIDLPCTLQICLSW